MNESREELVEKLRASVAKLGPGWRFELHSESGELLAAGAPSEYVDALLTLSEPKSLPATLSLVWLREEE